ncbi:MAG: cytochrome C oxidase subunit IV family protein [Phycisphaerales bacterium]|nr:cytochrome C oxidase subunit IV family protein [Phycisphaerales bacterium]
MAHAPAHAEIKDHAGAGHDDHDHGHVIVSLFTLRTILALLMFFTLLTVGLAQAEQLVASVFHVEIPQWINVFVALSIAAVKTTLVVMFFMQLKYDNPMNSAIFIFTLLTVCSFLGFTALDLGQRQSLDRYKGQYVKEGGYGGLNKGVLKGTTNTSIAEASINAAKNANEYHPHHDDHGVRRPITEAGFLAPTPKVGSSPNVSRPVTGTTLPELGAAPAGEGHDGHAEPHAEKPAAGH